MLPHRLLDTRFPRGSRKLTLLASTALIGVAIALPARAQTLPTGGQVVAGAATVQSTGQAMTVTTATQRTVIDWNSFSVATDHRLTFNQPDAASITVNRVVGVDPSSIFGTISSNGRVVIANPNGVWFGPSARVDVAGIVASAGRISDPAVQQFAAGGALTIDAGRTGATVINDGIITAREGGFAALVAPGVRNAGTITARLGRVALASGQTTTVDFYGDGLINLKVGGMADQIALDAAVSNSGSIYAEGGQVRVSASVAGGVLDNVINMSGVIEARGVSTAGGVVELLAGSGSVDLAGRIDVSGTGQQDGGRIAIQAGDATARDGVVNLTGSLAAGAAGGTGGTIEATSRFTYIGGAIAADGATGGTVHVSAVGITQAGSVTAKGAGGAGGGITLDGAQNITQTAQAVTSASSEAGAGGAVLLHGGASGRIFSSGLLTATGQSGGSVGILAKDIALAAATVDASGTIGDGGAVLVGGDLHGTGPQTATTTLVNGATTLRADGGSRGDGGRVVVWSDSKTDYQGSATARGGAIAGDGGTIEVSSGDHLTYGGSGDASAKAGAAGTLLLDPKNIVISETTGGLAVFDLSDPNAGVGSGFGDTSVQLANGTIVLTKPGDTVGGAINAGSVYYYDPHTGALLSVFHGVYANDRVGGGTGYQTGLTFLDPNARPDPVSNLPVYDTSKAYLIVSPSWNGQRGALTWVAANHMAGGIVWRTNSLVGSSANDLVGSMDDVSSPTFTVLATGNVLVRSPNWGDGRGALTFIDATTGLVGSISAANSIVGSISATANGHGLFGDALGRDGVETLSNGDFVVRSGSWNLGGGALTFGSAATGFLATGTLSGSNSLIGNGGTIYSAVDHTSAGAPVRYRFYGGDNLGQARITQLSNGNLIVANAGWGHARGAVSLFSGGGALSGMLSSANSLVGTTKGSGDTSDGTDTYFLTSSGVRKYTGGDAVGSGAIVELSNHGFVIASPNWSTNQGAVTFYANGTSGLSGTVSTSNSLTGTHAGSVSAYNGDHDRSVGGGDQIGGVTALANGNYVVSAASWNGSRGAVTVLDGLTGQTLTGSNGSVGDTVSTSNSLTGGNANDAVGTAVYTLAGTSDFVTASDGWGGGKGAVTRVDGTNGMAATVGSGNSLVGVTGYEQSDLGGDNVGSSVVALPNGAYVILSPNWNKTRGAATFVAAGGSITGNISSTNSLVGTTGAEGDAVYCNACGNGQPQIFGGDAIGGSGISILSNGNFLIASPGWSQQRGALTFVNGTTGALLDGTGSLTGSVSAANSLVGTQAAARYVSSVNLPYSTHTVGMRYWVGGDRIGSPSQGDVAAINQIGSDSLLLFENNWHNRTGAVVLGKIDGTFAAGGALVGQIGSANSLIGTTASTIYTPSDVTQADRALKYDGDQVGANGYKLLADGRIALFSPNWSGTRGAITLMNGTTGIQGVVDAANSAVGTQPNDQIGSGGAPQTYELANGKTVFVNAAWNGMSGAVTEVASGASFVGTLDDTNSLIGNAGDTIGSGGLVLLPGSSYLVNSGNANGGQGAITYHDGATPLTGTLNPRNSFYGDANLALGSGAGFKLATPGSLLMNFSLEGSGHVYLGFNDPTGWTYARATQSTLTIAPSLIETSLNAGTSLVLQASNDITINDRIRTTAGATGSLTLEAGRSIVGYADIGLGTGALTLLANNSVAKGVVDNMRRSGNAVVDFGASTTISTTGAVSIKLAASSDKTNNDAGEIALGAITAGSVDIRNLGSANGTLLLKGAITATATGTSILLATGGAFASMAGTNALSAGPGRFLVYSADPRNNSLGGLASDGKFYGRTLAANPPGSLSPTGNLFLYSVVPTLTVTGNATVGYGDAAGSIAPTISGLIDGDTRSTALTGAATMTTGYQAGDAVGGSYAVTVAQGTLASPLGYAFHLADGTVTVTPKALTLALTGSVDKTYDRTTLATLAAGNYQLTGLYGTDSISVAQTAGTFATADAGTNLGVSVSLAASDFAAGAGTSLSNYVLPTGTASAAIGTIIPRAVTLSGLAAASRVYDGTTAATLSGGTLVGVLNGDAVSLTAGTGTFADRNAGIGKAVGLSGFALTGAASGNYALSQPIGITADISAASLTLNGVAALDRDYDGTTAVALSGGVLSGIIGSDMVGFVAGTGTAASRNAGTRAVAVGGYALNGADAGNYTLAGQPQGLSVAIGRRAVTLSGVSAMNRVYDGTTGVGLSDGSVAGLLAGDAVSLVQGTGSMADRAIGLGKVVTVSGFGLSGADAGNYALGGVPASLTVDIAAKALSLSGVVAQNRVYDGTTAVSLSGGMLSGIVGGDTVGLVAGTGTLADRNVGLGKTVTVGGFGLSGSDAGNYVLAGQPGDLTVDIAAKTIALAGVTAQARAYDGTTAVALSGGSLSGIVGGDAVGFVAGTGTAASRNAGTQAVAVGGYALNGADAGNYTLAGQPQGLSVAIAPAKLSVSFAGNAVSKTYDGTTGAALTTASYRIDGVVAGESISLGKANGSFAAANAGTGLTLSVALSAGDYLAAAGTSLSNYALQTGVLSGAAGTILPAALLVSADDQTRKAGDPMPILTATTSGFVGGDTAASTGLSLALSTDASVQSPPGRYAIAVSGGKPSNYAVTYRPGIMTVTPAPVPVPLQALIAAQPVQAVIAAPAVGASPNGEVAIATGLATSFVPAAPSVPLAIGHADARLGAGDQSARGANDYANSFLSSIQLESRP